MARRVGGGSLVYADGVGVVSSSLTVGRGKGGKVKMITSGIIKGIVITRSIIPCKQWNKGITKRYQRNANTRWHLQTLDDGY